MHCQIAVSLICVSLDLSLDLSLTASLRIKPHYSVRVPDLRATSAVVRE